MDDIEEQCHAKGIQYVKGTLEIEGYTINAKDLELFEDIEDNGYSKEEIIRRILREHNIKTFE